MFVLKKIIASFLMPLPIFFILFGLGLFLLYMKKRQRAVQMLTVALIWITLLSYTPFSGLLLAPLENIYPKWQPGSEQPAYIHVLGSGHDSDARLPLSSQPNPTGLIRTIEGVMIYRQSENAKLIFSGYGGDDPVSNAEVNAAVGMALGVPRKDIIVLTTPKDTDEEAAAAGAVAGDKQVILVTSAIHMPRAVALFRKAGVNVIPAPTDYKCKDTRWLQWPSSAGLQLSEHAFHEYLGILWLAIKH
ncbi:ElyC/SanA/YdcF family protein [Sulfurimonas sp. HSL1-2]|uniref:ElyC/SanA/YdcF family protein n=1 Tax=Thiomicrolovo zhangzhouensis TaxID=3131933 RepID=UPI0031F90A00